MQELFRRIQLPCSFNGASNSGSARRDSGKGTISGRPLHQRTFQIAKGIFDTRQQNIGAPDVVRREILSIGFQGVRAIELRGPRLLRGVGVAGEGAVLGVQVAAWGMN